MKGLVHIYYGDGKGKTTAAIGLGIRAMGAGLKVYLAQFLKANSSNELKILSKINSFTIADMPNKLPFFFKMSPKEKRDYTEYALKVFQTSLVKAADFDLLILDEVLDAVELGIIPESEILTFLEFRPAKLEVVLTGHSLSSKIYAAADYVSHITAKKHPFNEGIKARKGIEY